MTFTVVGSLESLLGKHVIDNELSSDSWFDLPPEFGDTVFTQNRGQFCRRERARHDFTNVGVEWTWLDRRSGIQ